MKIMSASQFHVYLPCLGTCLVQCLNSVLHVKVIVGAFNQEKALVMGAFSVIVKTNGLFAALGNIGRGVCRGAHYCVCRDDEDQQSGSSSPAHICQQDLDPTHFAPTGDIYSYFQRRRRDPFHFANPLQHSVKNRLGGRHGKYFVY